MEIASNIVFNVGLLFIMMIPGIIINKCKLADGAFGKGISNLVLYVAQPALIFLAYLKEYSYTVLINSLVVLLLSVIAHGIFCLALLFFRKTTDDRQRMLRFATIFSNAAFMGIPLITAVLGAEYTIYASIYNITFNMFLWTLGVHICTAGNTLDDGTVLKSEASPKKALLHPVTIAAALGLVFFFLPIHSYVPEIIDKSLNMVANLVAPLSMLVLGLRIAEIDLKGAPRVKKNEDADAKNADCNTPKTPSFFADINLYVFIGLRHFIMPALVIGAIALLKLVGLPIDSEITTVVVIMASAPAASSAAMFAEKYDCDAAYVSKLVAFSTIISIASMPLMSMLASLV